MLVAVGLLLRPSATSTSDPSLLPHSVQISYQRLHDTSSKPLATVSYNPSTLKTQLDSWTPPEVAPSDSSSSSSTSSPLILISVPKGGTSTTSLATFSGSLNQTITLWLSPDEPTVFSASISASAPPTAEELKEQARLERRASRSASKAAASSSTGKKPSPSSNSNKKKRKSSSSSSSSSSSTNKPPEKSSGNVYVDLRRPVPGPRPALQDRKPPTVGADGQEIPEAPERTFLQKYWWVLLVGMILLIQGGGAKE